MNKQKRTIIFLSIVAFAILIVILKPTSTTEKNTVPGLENNKPAILLFSSNSCKSCLEMKKIMAKLKENYGEDIQFLDVRVDYRENEPILEHFNVRMIPTTVFLDAAGTQIDYRVGVLPEPFIVERLQIIKGD